MRVTVEAKPLSAALADISGLIKRGVDILQCVQITAKDNTLRLVTSDAEIEGHARIEAAVADEGRVCVSASDFKYAIAGAASTVELALGEKGLAVSGANINATLPPRYEEFPRLEQPDEMEEIEQGVQAFLSCEPAAAKDETRWNLTGVGFNGETAVGTNGMNARFHRATGGGGQIVPIRAKAILSKIKGRLFVGETLWRAENVGRVVVGRLVDANCVDISKLPQDLPYAWTCDADELRAKIDAVTFNRASVVVLSGEADAIYLTAEKFEGAHIDAKAEVKAEGAGGATVVCSAQGLRTILGGMTGDLRISTNGNAIEFCAGDLRGLSMVMRDHRNTGPVGAEV
ncbi:MAG: hypothetical protein AB3N24_10605 [Leisingera sp.]